MLTEKEFKTELEEVAFQIFMSEAEFIKTGEFCNNGGAFIDGVEVIDRKEDVIEWYLHTSLGQLRKEAGISYSRLCRRLARCFANDYIAEHYKHYKKEYLKENPQLEIKEFALSDYFSASSNGNYLAKAFVKIENDVVSVGCDCSERAVDSFEIDGTTIYFNPNFDEDVLKTVLESEKEALSIIANQQLFDDDEVEDAKFSLAHELDSCYTVVPYKKYETMTFDDIEKVSKCLSPDDFVLIFDRYELTPKNMKIKSVDADDDEVRIYAITEKIGEVEEEYVFYLPLEALADFSPHDDFEQSSFFEKMIDEHFSDSPRIYDEKQILRDVISFALAYQKGLDIVGKDISMPID